jgi:signal transduction histidine kinase
MFESARIRLTAWYLLIIMSVSVLFSFVIYNGVNDELKSFEQREETIQQQIEQTFPFLPDNERPHVDLQPIKAARTRLITSLGFINLVILVVSGVAGYFLAGRTLRPIRSMVDQLNRFISDASHELRTPITSLRSEMEVGLRSKKLTLPQAKKLIESNLEEVIKLQTLSDNLLELTQYEKMNGTGTFRSVSLEEVIRIAVKNVQGQAKKKQITIETVVKDIMVFGSSDRLSELFTILLDNAVKYSSVGSSVTITGSAKGNTALIAVRDHGIGISKKDLGHIFERFYRSDSSRSKEVSGFGLGLSIAKRIIVLHKGSIQVVSAVNRPARNAAHQPVGTQLREDSVAGGGTTFTIRLARHKTS